MALPETASAADFRITTQPTKTYAMDFENKRIVGWVDGLDAMVQAVRKAISTRRYAERIYSGDYGSELDNLIGKAVGYVRATIRLVLEETFSADSRIRGLRRIDVEQRDCDSMQVNATVLTEYGEIYTEQTIRG